MAVKVWRVVRRSVLGVAALTLVCLGGPSSGMAATVMIPTNIAGAPAADLVYKGEVIDKDTAAGLIRQGVDLSKLSPLENDVWQDQEFFPQDSQGIPSQNGNQIEDKDDVPTFVFEDFLESSKGLFRVQVSRPRGFQRLGFSLDSLAALARARLLQKLGYKVQMPKYLPLARLRFSSASQMDKLLDGISDKSLMSRNRWVESKTDLDLVIRNVVVEDPHFANVHYWGSISSTHIKGLRALRALILPYALLDVQESINMFGWEFAQILGENLSFVHTYAASFAETTMEDVKWMARRISKLTEQDWAEVVQAGHFPKDVQDLLIEKVKSRRNGLLRLLGSTMKESFAELSVNTQLQNPSVKKGKLVVKEFQGYPQFFIYGDPISPLRRSEIEKYLDMEGYSIAINQAVSRLNEVLVARGIQDVAKKHGQDMFQSMLEHFKNHPTEPYIQSVDTWGGPIGGLQVGTARNVVTGTYYGSDSRVQLVDTVSVGAQVGWFTGIDMDYTPGMRTSANVVRNYAHVRPMPGIEAASKEKWKSLYVPSILGDLKEVLSSDINNADATLDTSWQSFLKTFKEGEILTVTDSLVLSNQGQIGIPISALLGTNLTVANNVALSAGVSWLNFRRTTFMREGGLVKIYQTTAKNLIGSLGLDLSYWMRLFSMVGSQRKGEAQTFAFHLDEKPPDASTTRKTVSAIKASLQGTTELLQEHFAPFQLNHQLESQNFQDKFLVWQWGHIDEKHKVEIRPAIKKDADKWVRTLVSQTKTSRHGKNYYDLVSDVIDGVITQSSNGILRPGFLPARGGSNPADSFLGVNQHHSVRTEGEVSSEIAKDRPYLDVSTIENVWQGWILSQSDLNQILDSLQEKMRESGVEFLVDKNAFKDTQRLEFYEIQSLLLIGDGGVKKIESQFSRLDTSQYRADDRRLIEFLIDLYGSNRFAQWCREEELLNSKRTEGLPMQIWWYGNGYDCLMPFMIKALKMNHNKPKQSDARITWLNEVVSLLEENLPHSRLIEFLGTRNVFYQLRVSGFRVNDENGDSNFLSHTIGRFQKSTGIYRQLGVDTKISSHELYGRYLNEGY